MCLVYISSIRNAFYSTENCDQVTRNDLNFGIITYRCTELPFLKAEYKLVMDVMYFVLRTLHNYMMWHLVKSLSALLSKPFKDARKEFMKALTGERSLLCGLVV